MQVEHDEAIVERLEDVLVELAQPGELVGLGLQLPVEAAVLERRGDLPGNGREQRHVFAVQRLGALLAAEPEHRDRAFLRHARHEVVQAPVAPELDLVVGEAPRGERIVERDDVPGFEAAADAGAPAEAGRR